MGCDYCISTWDLPGFAYKHMGLHGFDNRDYKNQMNEI
jgi:hypothetical protein